MRYTIYYDKTLKLTPEKLASQVAHITLNLGYYMGESTGFDQGIGVGISLRDKELHGDTKVQDTTFNRKEQTIIVLGLSHTKFESTLNALRQRHQHTGGPSYHVQTDLGLTEVKAGTITAFGIIN